MFFPKALALIAMLTASAGAADTLADMDGAWRGSGWAKQTPQGAKEAVRCQIRNTYDAAVLTLTLTGMCAVPGRRLEISGALTGKAGAEQITGRWSNPDGLGSTQITGLQRAGIVAFTFRAVDPGTGRKVSQNVEWRVAQGTLRLRATDRADPSIMMSDITFQQP